MQTTKTLTMHASIRYKLECAFDAFREVLEALVEIL